VGTGFARDQTLFALRAFLVPVVVRMILCKVRWSALRLLIVGGLVAWFFVSIARVISLMNTDEKRNRFDRRATHAIVKFPTLPIPVVIIPSSTSSVSSPCPTVAPTVLSFIPVTVISHGIKRNVLEG
jgi:hypothetical protein